MNNFKRVIFPLSALFFLKAACILSRPAVGNSAPATTPYTGPTAEPASLTPPAGVQTLHLIDTGQPRLLPNNILGASVESLIEHILDDPQKIAAIQQTAPGVIRFPGGSQSNYYNWQTGLLDFNPMPNSSSYYKFWAGVAPKIARAFPTGIHMEQYQPFATQIGADVILVPNLETSSVSQQTAWFTQLAADHSLPGNIELGNEFYIAMANDPNVIRKWTDEPTSLAVMKQYEDALRPILGQGAKFAIQSAGSHFYILPNTSSSFQQRLLTWDNSLAPADWFQAVTVHLYPDPGLMIKQAGNPGSDQLFELFMGRADAGVDRELNDLTARLPGKEIWITEWSPRGGNFADTFGDPDMVPPQMNAQLVARETLAFLRHPEVTRSLYFTLNADSKSVFRAYVSDVNGNYLPLPVAVVLQWFDEAANKGSTFQRVMEANSQPVIGLGVFSESYQPVEGGFFTSASGTTLILQNASSRPLWYDPSQQGQKPHPNQVEILAADNFTDLSYAAAQVQTLDPNAPVMIPPFSLLRMVWNNP